MHQSINFLKLHMNNITVKVSKGTTIMQACVNLRILITKSCYHNLLEVAGNCRICLVGIQKSPKPQASCSLPVVDQIRIYTNIPLVKKAQENVLEFLFINYPLDGLICDQGGDCDLQNHALNYGTNQSRFYNIKRSVEDKSKNKKCLF